MKILLTGINAKYIHSCLAVHSLAKYAAAEYGLAVQTAEYTINQLREDVLADLYRQAPDLLGFSCYIWNIGFIRPLIREIRQVLPAVKILLGGPEVSFDPAEALSYGADYVLSGEGEESFSRLCLALEEGTPLSEVPGLSWSENGICRQNEPPKPLDMAKLPFVYEDFSLFADRILYYEAQRGCPFNCQYCLSSVDKGVRFQPIEKVERELQVFLDKKVRQVKFVDRTFNASPKFAMAVWQYLHEHDNGVTNFHFELAAELLTDEMLAFLPTVRPGLFQFEIGVQTTYAPTLGAIDRRSSFESLTRKVRALQKAKNIHLHLDLIAGLPYESFAQFRQSFNDVYGLDPDQFQLGFLKLLKGAGLFRDREKYGLTARSYPPFEILSTPALPYEDVLRLKVVEEMVEQYYNSGRFVHTLRWLFTRMDDPFLFYQQLGDRYVENRLHLSSQSLESAYSFFYEFAASLPYVNGETMAQYLKLDYCLHQRPKRFPAWYPGPDAVRLRRDCIAFLTEEENRQRYLPQQKEPDPQKLYKLCWFEPFSFDILSGEDSPCVLLFDYSRRDLLGNAHAEKVTLPKLAD